MDKNLLGQQYKSSDNLKIPRTVKGYEILENGIKTNRLFPSQSQNITASGKQRYCNLYFTGENMQPNVKSGIFRKDSTQNVDQKYKQTNVFISPDEGKGRIINIKDFHELYVRDVNEKHVQSNSECCDSNKSHIDLQKHTEKTENLSQSKRTFEIESDDLLKQSPGTFERGNNTTSCDRRICDNTPLQAVASKKKVIYRIIHPEELSLHSISNAMDPGKASISFTTLPLNEQESSFIVKPDNTQLEKPPGQRGRPRKSQRTKISTESPPKVTQLVARTRSGRISKPPKHIQNNFQSDINIDQTPIFEKNPDTNYKCNIAKITKLTTEINPQLNNSMSILLTDGQKIKRERIIPPEYRCDVCQKIYLGKTRMLKHVCKTRMEAYPEHFTNSSFSQTVKEMSLYQFLLKKIKLNTDNEEQRVEIFLNELSDLFDQLHSRNFATKRHTSSVHFINARVGCILGVPEGHFEIDINAIDAIPNTSTKPEPRLFAPPPRLDYNLSISLDDTIADAKLNLSDNMITSEDSLLRMTVDDLVKDRIKHLNYDHSDNAVEAEETQPPPMLDLSLDLFQFSSN